MRASPSSVYFESGKRFASSLNASKASRVPFESRSVMSGLSRMLSRPVFSLKFTSPFR